MQRAASGLAYAVARLPRQRLRRAGSCCWSAPATTAATRCTPARRSPAAARGVDARAARRGQGARRGLAALRAAGGRVVADVAGAHLPDVAVDGIVGIGGSGRPASRRRRASSTHLRGVPFVAVDAPSGVDVDTGRSTARTSRPRSPSPSAPTRSRTSSTPPPRRAARSTSSTSASTCRPPRSSRSRPTTSRALLPRPRRGATSTPAAWSASAPARRSTAAPACSASSRRPPAGARPAMVRLDDRGAAVADLVQAAHPEVVVGAGRVQAWVVGSGGGARRGDQLARGPRGRGAARGGRRRARRR